MAIAKKSFAGDDLVFISLPPLRITIRIYDFNQNRIYILHDTVYLIIQKKAVYRLLIHHNQILLYFSRHSKSLIN